MEALTCASCGGALAKAGETTYRCTHCGTTHELGPDDTLAVRALVERNNERWVYINRRMDEFYAAINRTAEYDTKRIKYLSWFRNALLFGVAWFALFALAAATMPATSPQKPEFAASLGIVPWLVVALAVTGVLAVTHLSLRNATLRNARAIIADVLGVYRSMSDKPVKDLLQSLHNPRQITFDGAPEVASLVYGEIIAAAQSPAAHPQPRPA